MSYIEDNRKLGAQKYRSLPFFRNRLTLTITHPEYWLPILILIMAVGCWEGAARWEIISTLFFPAPSIIMQTLIRSFIDGELLNHLGATLSRVLLAFMIGGLPAMIIGLTMGWSRRLRAGIDPVISAIHPLPKIALLPLAMILFGIGELSKVITAASAAFFPMLINCMTGVLQINVIYFEVAKNFRANPFRIFTRVVWPGSLPMVIAGSRVAFNIALVVTISIELVSAQKGLGVMIWFGWEAMRTEELYAGLIVISALGICINFILKRLEIYLVPWKHEHKT